MFPSGQELSAENGLRVEPAVGHLARFGHLASESSPSSAPSDVNSASAHQLINNGVICTISSRARSLLLESVGTFLGV